MKVFSRELCEKLQKLGCKGESDLGFVEYNGNWFPAYMASDEDNRKLIPVFSQNDFTGCHEQAKDNAKIVWGNGESGVWRHEYIRLRHAMIEAPDAEEYLKETMKRDPSLEEASKILNGAMTSDWTGEREASKEDSKGWLKKWGFEE